MKQVQNIHFDVNKNVVTATTATGFVLKLFKYY